LTARKNSGGTNNHTTCPKCNEKFDLGNRFFECPKTHKCEGGCFMTNNKSGLFDIGELNRAMSERQLSLAIPNI